MDAIKVPNDRKRSFNMCVVGHIPPENYSLRTKHTLSVGLKLVTPLHPDI